MTFSRKKSAASGGVFLLLSVVYLWRLSPSVGWGASADHALAAWRLSAVSPLGFPLFSMISRIAAVPAPDFAFGLNIGVALLLALGCGVFCAALARKGAHPAAAAAGALLVGLCAPALQLARTADPAVFAMIGFVLLGATFSGAYHTPGRNLFLFSLAAGLLAPTFLFVSFVGIACCVFLLSRHKLPRRLHLAAPAALLLLVGLTPALALALRGTVQAGWPGALPVSWADVLEMMRHPLFLGEYFSIDVVRSLALEAMNRLTGPMLPALLAAGAGAVLWKRERGAAAWWPVATVPLCFAALFFSLGKDSEIAWLFIVVVVAAYASEGLAAAARARGAAVAGVLGGVCVAAALYPTAANLWKPRPVYALAYAEKLIFATPRDSVVFVESAESPTGSFAWLRQGLGGRRDVTLLYPSRFNRTAYRRSVQLEPDDSLGFPSEKDYNTALGQVLSMSQAPGVTSMSNETRLRMLDTTELFLREIVAFKNSAKRPVSFTRVGPLVNSKMFDEIGFKPEGYLFHLTLGEANYQMFKALATAKTKMSEDPEASRRLAGYFADIGENDYKRKRYDLGEVFLLAALRLDPDNIRTHFVHAMNLRMQGEFSRATKEYQNALNLIQKKSPSFQSAPYYQFMIGTIYLNLGMPGAAQPYLDRAGGSRQRNYIGQ